MEDDCTNAVYPLRTSSSEGAQKSIVVVGVERGGTSMVAGVLRALGVHMGERTGRNHEDPSFQIDDPVRLKRVIKSRNFDYDIWGFKYPRASLMMDFYDENLRNPYYILVSRNIASVVDSWCARGENDPIETALHAVRYYAESLGVIKASSSPAILVNYERACQYPANFIEDLGNFIGTPVLRECKLKALNMITGEGGGYVNVPEHNFYIARVEGKCGSIKEIEVNSEPVSFIGKVHEVDIPVYGVACYMKDKEAFPEEFYLNVQSGKAEGFHDLRFYADFGDGFFARHSYPIDVHEEGSQFKVVSEARMLGVCLAGENKGLVKSLVVVPVLSEKGGS